jgi:predicted amidohydrolase
MRRGEPSMARASIVISPVAIVRVVKANRDLIAGVKVRLGRNAGGAGVAPSTLRSRSQKRPGFPEFDLIWIALDPV